MKVFLGIWISLSIFVCIGCSTNILESFADTQSDEALLFKAKMKINSGDYDLALTYFQSMSATFLSRRDVVGVQASAYAGKCGLNFLELVDGITNIGTARLFILLMTSFQSGTTDKRDACIAAENLMQTISTSYSSRSSDENLFLALVDLSKMGVIFNRVADSNNDGTTDGGFDACSAADFPDADVRQIGTAINLLRTSVNGVSGTTFGGFASNINDVCDNWPGGMLASYNFCIDGSSNPVFDGTSFTANQLKGIRSLVNESDVVGLGSCTGDIIACACP